MTGLTIPPEKEQEMPFEPLHNAHAIEEVALSITFQLPVDDANLRAARDAIGNPVELPGRLELRSVQVGPGSPVQTLATTNGYAFTRTRPDGAVETELHVLRNAVQFRTTAYTRWAAVWEPAGNFLARAVAIYARRSRLTQATLQYVDKFVSDEPPQQARPTTILQRNSPYIAPRIFEANDFWHCYSGAFSRVNERTKRLTTVNLEYVTETLQGDGRQRQALRITGVLADLFNQPGYAVFEPAAERLMNEIDASFQALHQAAKDSLRSIITPEMARRIALDG